MLLAESIKKDLVDALHQQAFTVGGKTFNSESRRGFEEALRNEAISTISVEFVNDDVIPVSISNVIGRGSNDAVGTFTIFGHKVVTEVVIVVSAKEKTINSARVNPRLFVEAIIDVVKFRIRKYWERILADHKGSIDYSRPWSHGEISGLVSGEMRSRRVLRLWIKHEEAYTFVENDDLGGYPTRGIFFDAKDEGNDDDFEYYLVEAPDD